MTELIVTTELLRKFLRKNFRRQPPLFGVEGTDRETPVEVLTNSRTQSLSNIIPVVLAFRLVK